MLRWEENSPDSPTPNTSLCFFFGKKKYCFVLWAGNYNICNPTWSCYGGHSGKDRVKREWWGLCTDYPDFSGIDTKREQFCFQLCQPAEHRRFCVPAGTRRAGHSGAGGHESPGHPNPAQPGQGSEGSRG